MWTYEIAPIDFRWELLQSVADVAAQLARADAEALSGEGDSGLPSCEEFLDAWVKAKQSAEASGWDGDIRTGPVVFWLPSADRFEYGFAFKQDNNGNTFVISPQELPHLEAL
ncbi:MULTISPECIES: hypothetical protein [unclassified Acidovorax]|uniref:hypothetical protein n=1 Tax=unclassified Acidovorax TaxID=2684926 RepID=UPI001C43D0C2|nr:MULTISPECIES: hypothetical protein [unclassified Acidovorax]MBV7459475.1 hypothetical protein [Acidovorax sp. sif0632]MBV7464500.1 hypothetical protein [Acidovorax sp. sif0613]